MNLTTKVCFTNLKKKKKLIQTNLKRKKKKKLKLKKTQYKVNGF